MYPRCYSVTAALRSACDVSLDHSFPVGFLYNNPISKSNQLREAKIHYARSQVFMSKEMEPNNIKTCTAIIRTTPNILVSSHIDTTLHNTLSPHKQVSLRYTVRIYDNGTCTNSAVVLSSEEGLHYMISKYSSI